MLRYHLSIARIQHAIYFEGTEQKSGRDPSERMLTVRDERRACVFLYFMVMHASLRLILASI